MGDEERTGKGLELRLNPEFLAACQRLNQAIADSVPLLLATLAREIAKNMEAAAAERREWEERRNG